MPSGRQRAASAASMASRSMPFWPITTSRLRRASPGAQGRSNWWRKRAPTPCTSRRIGLPATSTKPFMRSTSCALGHVGEPASRGRRVRRRPGGRATKLSKSSWSWPSSASWCEGRLARSSSAAAARPSSTAASMRPSRGLARSSPRVASRRRSRPTRGQLGRVEQVGLVEDHEVGAEKLVLVDLLQRVVVVDGLVVLALR